MDVQPNVFIRVKVMHFVIDVQSHDYERDHENIIMLIGSAGGMPSQSVPATEFHKYIDQNRHKRILGSL